jgi:hypothetical protein
VNPELTARGSTKSSDFWALTYADRRTSINEFLSIRKRPWIVLLWILWFGTIGGFAILRTMGPRHEGVPFWQVALQDTWVCGAIVIFGLMLAAGTSRYVGFFDSRAEALMLIRSPLHPSIVAAYLQVRAVASTLLTMFGRFAYILLIALPLHTSIFGLAREALLLASVTTAVACVPLPRALAQGWWRVACVIAGSAIAFVGVLPLVRDAVAWLKIVAFAAVLLAALPDWHPGNAVTAVAGGDLMPIGIALMVGLSATLAFLAASRDAYPELFALSIAHLELREKIRARRSARAENPTIEKGSPKRATSRGTPFRGAISIVWLDAITWARRAPPLTTVLIVTGALLGGFAIGYAARSEEYGAYSITLFGALANLYIGIAATGGVKLAGDLRRPLFWLGGVPLGSRLAAWCFAPLWRDAVFVGLLSLGYAVISRNYAIGFAVFSGGVAVAMLGRSAAIAIFALLPNALEQRGPALFLRLFLSYMLVFPVGVLAVVAAFFSRSVVIGVFIGAVPAIIEATILIFFAAWRLAGRVDRLARA